MAVKMLRRNTLSSVSIWGNNDEDAVKISILDCIHNFIISQQNDVPIPIRDFVIVDNGTYEQFPWGKLSFKSLMNSYRCTMNFTKKLYRLRGMSYALQVWIYECCMQLPPTLVVRHDNLVPRILNWRVVDSQPKFNTIMESIFSNEGNIVSTCSW
ncbi:hypothetical protein KY290_007662 [Solanum tuberosum]|uniref:DUF1985 domain-containing protein n=1 Tax=Solanum tuberosum TaxID=4113 RepID=A0ABQ7W7J3_SOLTU|nr:hypothetical protein KY290_007662 [Solanum tuberosum]